MKAIPLSEQRQLNFRRNQSKVKKKSFFGFVSSSYYDIIQLFILFSSLDRLNLIWLNNFRVFVFILYTPDQRLTVLEMSSQMMFGTP